LLTLLESVTSLTDYLHEMRRQIQAAPDVETLKPAIYNIVAIAERKV